MFDTFRFIPGGSISNTRSNKLNVSTHLRTGTWNGEIISELISDLCLSERPRSVLLIRTPTTGAWLETINWPAGTSVTTLNYADEKQCSLADSSFMDRNSFTLRMKRMASLKSCFDIIAIDPFHEYTSSQLDLELCISCLDQDGVLLSHDCSPSSSELADPEFRLGNWCGATYAALTVIALHHPELAFTVLDTDTGVGIIRHRSSKHRSHWLPPANLNAAKQEKLRSLFEARQYKRSYKYFRSHGRKLVDLRLQAPISEQEVLSGTPISDSHTSSPARLDSIEIPIQGGAYLLVFHKDLDIGGGPALSLYIHELEVLKFDCFGAGKGHFHVQPHAATRLMMSERSIRGQVIRATREIRTNAASYASWNVYSSPEPFTFDQASLEQATTKAKKLLMQYATLYEPDSMQPGHIPNR